MRKALLVAISSVCFVTGAQATEDRDPEAASGFYNKKAVTGNQFMVAAANPHASKAGYDILAKGGSAIDAAIAVQAVLTLVEPQSSGIGGGAFILHWDKKRQQLKTYDGRETAPAAAGPDWFIKPESGEPMRWREAVVGGRSVGVPGVLKALHMAHRQHGKLPWSSLFEHAIKLADKGFEVSPRMAKQLAGGMNPGVLKLPGAKDYFSPGGKVLKAGDLRTNKPLAKILRKIANEGIDGFYKGDNAKAIVAAVQGDKNNPGKLTLKDLAGYEAKIRPPLCADYQQYRICGMGPPSSGGFTVLQMLALLEPFKLAKYAVNNLEAVHLFTQASRLAYADRNRYMADSDFVEVPVNQLLAPNYLAKRSMLIKPDKDMGKARPGLQDLYAMGHDDSIELPSTSHLSIVDSKGNAISMTTSIEHGFGSAVMVNGYLLNNQMTDFSFNPKNNGKLVANRVEAGKRPRSSMAPMMIFDRKGQLKMIIGSPGGSRIISYVAQTIVGVLDWDLDIQQAISMPKATNRNDQTNLEADTGIAALKAGLEKLGHAVSVRSLNSGLHGIVISDKKLTGGADPRREGVVLAR